MSLPIRPQLIPRSTLKQSKPPRAKLDKAYSGDNSTKSRIAKACTVEYAILPGLIAVVALTLMDQIGPKVTEAFEHAAELLPP